jgi:hypothetical protein
MLGHIASITLYISAGINKAENRDIKPPLDKTWAKAQQCLSFGYFL